MLSACKTFVFAALFIPVLAIAQQDSVRQLQEVVIEQSRLQDYQLSNTITRLDSAALSQNSSGTLADLLRKSGIGHLRSYGPGGLATPSFRGTGANHTTVLWNGINLSSPLSGQLDFSQVPVTFIDEASIQQGGAASLFGSGTIGGTIHLNNKAVFNDGLKLSTYHQVGSYSSVYNAAGFSLSGKKVITKLSLFHTSSDNDFTFVSNNTAIAQKLKREHSAYAQQGILQQLYWQVQPRQLLSLKLWYQDNFLEVPNTTFNLAKAEATQSDKSLRSLLGWHYEKGSFSIQYQGAYIHNGLKFIDPLISTNSNNEFSTLLQTAELNYAWKKWRVASGLNYTREKGKVENFNGVDPLRNRIAAFSAIKYTIHTSELALSLRQEVMNEKWIPLATSFNLTTPIHKHISIHGSVSRSYRLPTFNDLYWVGAGAMGNPNLLTETSWSEDLGVVFTKEKSTLKITVFNSAIDEWIAWAQNNETGIWSPRNTKKVWSRGIEATASTSRSIGKVMLELTGRYSYTKATNKEVHDSGSLTEVNKQLMLTPMHEGGSSLRLIWKKYMTNVVYSYTGKQYNSSDNSIYSIVKDYQLLHIWFSRTVPIKKTSASITCEINNLLNASYQSRPGYPMPGRNFKLTLTLQYHKPT